MTESSIKLLNLINNLRFEKLKNKWKWYIINIPPFLQDCKCLFIIIAALLFSIYFKEQSIFQISIIFSFMKIKIFHRPVAFVLEYTYNIMSVPRRRARAHIKIKLWSHISASQISSIISLGGARSSAARTYLLLCIPTRRFNLGWKNGARARGGVCGCYLKGIAGSVCHQRSALRFPLRRDRSGGRAHTKCGLEFVWFMWVSRSCWAMIISRQQRRRVMSTHQVGQYQPSDLIKMKY